MFIQMWIIVVSCIIAIIFLICWMGVSSDFKAFEKKSFIFSELKSDKFNLKISFFFPATELQTQTRALSRLEMLLETSHYGKDMFNLQTFEKLAKDLGYHHIVFSSLTENK